MCTFICCASWLIPVSGYCEWCRKKHRSACLSSVLTRSSQGSHPLGRWQFHFEEPPYWFQSPFILLPAVTKDPSFPTPSLIFLSFVVLTISFLIEVKWNLKEVFICITPMAKNIEQIPYIYWPLMFSLWKLSSQFICSLLDWIGFRLSPWHSLTIDPYLTQTQQRFPPSAIGDSG